MLVNGKPCHWFDYSDRHISLSQILSAGGQEQNIIGEQLEEWLMVSALERKTLQRFHTPVFILRASLLLSAGM